MLSQVSLTADAANAVCMSHASLALSLSLCLSPCFPLAFSLPRHAILLQNLLLSSRPPSFSSILSLSEPLHTQVPPRTLLFNVRDPKTKQAGPVAYILPFLKAARSIELLQNNNDIRHNNSLERKDLCGNSNQNLWSNSHRSPKFMD